MARCSTSRRCRWSKRHRTSQPMPKLNSKLEPRRSLRSSPLQLPMRSKREDFKSLMANLLRKSQHKRKMMLLLKEPRSQTLTRKRKRKRRRKKKRKRKLPTHQRKNHQTLGHSRKPQASSPRLVPTRIPLCPLLCSRRCTDLSH